MKVCKLNKEEVSRKVPNKKGVYLLGNIENGEFVVGYVGRSDYSLKNRLLNHNHFDQFEFFLFRETKTKREAFLLETEYWYVHKKNLINKIHPSIPTGIILEHPYDTLGKKIKTKILEGIRK